MSGVSRPIKLFLCGDVMTGRGIDQVLPHPGDPRLYEAHVDSALGYVALAETAHGAIPRPLGFADVWGDALPALAEAAPQARIVNLETAVTRAGAPEPKGINYRMHPANVGCLTAAALDCCVLANNHVLDWGEAGLLETLDTLDRGGLAVAGAGRDEVAARAPAVLELAGGGRVLVFAFGTRDSGIPPTWAAAPGRPGVALLAALSEREIDRIGAGVGAARRPGDLVVVSLHWGGNWGYQVPQEQRRFAHDLIERAGVDLVHGHSSHHARAIEVHRDKLVLYGCGDFLNDYEGIGGYESFRDDLVLAYLPTLDGADGRLLGLELQAYRIAGFRLRTARAEETAWLAATLSREGASFGTRLDPAGDGGLVLSRG